MTDESRKAETEAAFREVNEAIARTATRFNADEADFVCECADPECADRVTADLEDYEEVREESTHFILAPGHEQPVLERVIEQNGEYTVVEKLGSTVRSVVRRLDPRLRPT